MSIWPEPTFPDFVIIGAQKCATTSLLSYIGQHSRVRLSRKKSTHFFDLNHEKGARWYARHFPVARDLRFWRKAERNWLTGESCPSYMFLPQVPGRMKPIMPDVKLIAVLRDPVKRLVSQYFHEKRKGRCQTSFEDYVAQSIDLGWPVEGPLQKVLQTAAVPRGFYLAQLRHWLTFFPARNLKVVSFEDLISRPDEVMTGLFSFLGLPPENVDCSQVLNKGTGSPAQSFDPALMVRLRTLYATQNEGLEELASARLPWVKGA